MVYKPTVNTSQPKNQHLLAARQQAKLTLSSPIIPMSIIWMTTIPKQSEVSHKDCDRYSNIIDTSLYLWNL